MLLKIGMTENKTMTAADSGTFLIGGDLAVHRLGFGAMRITGAGVWGPPRDKAESLAVLRRAVELGTTLIDTAESYGPFVSEELIADALHPYPKDLVIATKGGFDRSGPGKWEENAKPERLREGLEGSLRRLRVERIDLWQLHRIDSKVPEEAQFAAVAQFQKEGKVRHVGLTETSVEQIDRARKFFPVASVQNRYNVADREWERVVDYCERESIGFIPWYPLAAGDLARPGSALDTIARKAGASTSQVALAWVLKRSPVMLPIPGTGKVAHLEDNVGAVGVLLSDEEFQILERRNTAENDTDPINT